jgi:hypothetical protein
MSNIRDENFEPPDKEQLLEKYNLIRPDYRKLAKEICFILKEKINGEQIKIHDRPKY